MDAAQNDAQLVVHLELDLVCMNRLPRKEKAKASQEYVKRLNKVFLGLIFDFDALSFRFETMDLSQDGVVTKEEFLQLCQDPTIRSYMTSLEPCHTKAEVISISVNKCQRRSATWILRGLVGSEGVSSH